jgi:hypothetical protein
MNLSSRLRFRARRWMPGCAIDGDEWETTIIVALPRKAAGVGNTSSSAEDCLPCVPGEFAGITNSASSRAYARITVDSRPTIRGTLARSHTRAGSARARCAAILGDTGARRQFRNCARIWRRTGDVARRERTGLATSRAEARPRSVCQPSQPRAISGIERSIPPESRSRAYTASMRGITTSQLKCSGTRSRAAAMEDASRAARILASKSSRFHGS